MAATSTVIELCTPPVPGQTHSNYGQTHNHYLKLPLVAQPDSVDAGALKKSEKTLHAAAAAGDLALLKQILPRLPDPLRAVNEPFHTSTGLTPIHFAASRGYVNVVQYLVEEYSVSVDMRDKEGETALLKAAYEGHYHVVQYLLFKNANIHQKDKDGWTALHNACSRGFIQIVHLLVDRGARVDVQSKTGHTPLINAASKGHLSIVEYLIKVHANPLIKNNFGETAYDVSAAAGEFYICEMLHKASQRRWDMQRIAGGAESQSEPYDLIQFHVTVMVVLHENQRSTSILGLTRPQFSAEALTKQDTCGPWSLYPSGTPRSKEEVALPSSSAGREGKSDWFWISDWQIDISDPRVDPTSGWQYARSFDDADDAWTPVEPTSGYGRVRRRRWVRVMKRRLDLAKPPNHGANEYDNEPEEHDDHNDYLTKVEDLVQPKATHSGSNPGNVSVKSTKALIHKLDAYEKALHMLLTGIQTDTNQHRKHQASVLAATCSAQIDNLKQRIAILAPTQTGISPHNSELAQDSRPISPAGITDDRTSIQNTDNRSLNSDSPLDTKPMSGDSASDPLTPATAVQASPSLGPVGEQQVDDTQPSLLDHEDADDVPRAFVWECDATVKECKCCNRRFGLLVRRHHCRHCGQIVCDRCSAGRMYLLPSEILQDPMGPTESPQVLASQQQRVCDKCFSALDFCA